MSNTNVTSPIALKGKGFRHKETGGPWLPGEFGGFHDVIYDSDGNIRNRGKINALGANPTTVANLDKPRGIIGMSKGQAIIQAGGSKMVDVDYDNIYQMAVDDADLPVDAGGQHFWTGFFDYNDNFYLLSYEFLNATDTWKLNVWKSTFTPTLNDPDDVTYASLTKTTIATGTTKPPTMNSFFIHKDRLWVVTENYVYYSKATDPTAWTVGVGLAGAYRIAGAQIKQAFAHSDTVYILSDIGVYALSYATDIDTDGYLRRLTTFVAETGVVHNDQIYLMSMDGLHLLQGGYTQLVFALRDVEALVDSFYNTKFKMVSWRQYIHIIKVLEVEFSSYANSTTNGDKGYRWDPELNNESYNWYVYDTLNDSVSVFAFTDRRDQTISSTAWRGFPCDIAASNFHPTKGTQGAFYFITCGAVNSGTPTYIGYCYRLTHENESTNSYDQARDTGGTHRHYPMKQTIEMHSYSPDGSEMLLKKFRGLIIEGSFDDNDLMQVQLAFDNRDYTRTLAIPATEDSYGSGKVANTPYVYRFPINQKARSIDIKISPSLDYNTEISGTPEIEYWVVSDIRLLWSTTQRLPETRYQSLA